MGRQAIRKTGRGGGRLFFNLEGLEARALLSAAAAGVDLAAQGTLGVNAATTVSTPATYIRLDATGTNIEIYAGSTPTGTPTVIDKQSATSITVAPSTGNDLLVVDYSNGDPVPSGGISYTGGGSSLGDKLQVIGASATDPFVLSAGQVQHGTGTLTYSNVLNVTISSGSATANSDLNLLGLTIGGQASLTATTAEHIGQLTVNSGGTATLHGLFGSTIVNGSLKFAPDGTDAGTSSLNNLLLSGSTDNWSGRVDVANNKLIVETTAANKAALLATLRNAVAYGTTHNTGIVSTDLPAHTVLAVIDAGTAGITTFGGVAIDANAILIAPEIPGDANLDGAVNLTDLSTVLNNFGSPATNWTSGNFGSGSTVNLTDLSAVLNNFGTTSSVAAAVATGAGAVAPASDVAVTPDTNVATATTVDTWGPVDTETAAGASATPARHHTKGFHGSAWHHRAGVTVRSGARLALLSA
ncbi:MAG: hypothetical protein ACTHN5_24050 [Phycisphaerae bacterium]